MTGMSEKRIAISEIGVWNPDVSFGEESRIGENWNFMLRDVLQFEDNLEDALDRMRRTRRTCNLILGVGDGNKANTVRSIQYSYSTFNVMDDTNLLPKNDSWHPK